MRIIRRIETLEQELSTEPIGEMTSRSAGFNFPESGRKTVSSSFIVGQVFMQGNLRQIAASRCRIISISISDDSSDDGISSVSEENYSKQAGHGASENSGSSGAPHWE